MARYPNKGNKKKDNLFGQQTRFSPYEGKSEEYMTSGSGSMFGSVEKSFKRLGDEVARQYSDVISTSTMGFIDPKEIRRQQKAAALAKKEAKKIQVEQKRAALLEQAEIANEIALRSKIAKKGGRRSLLSMGETGSLLV